MRVAVQSLNGAAVIVQSAEAQIVKQWTTTSTGLVTLDALEGMSATGPIVPVSTMYISLDSRRAHRFDILKKESGLGALARKGESIFKTAEGDEIGNWVFDVPKDDTLVFNVVAGPESNRSYEWKLKLNMLVNGEPKTEIIDAGGGNPFVTLSIETISQRSRIANFATSPSVVEYLAWSDFYRRLKASEEQAKANTAQTPPRPK